MYEQYYYCNSKINGKLHLFCRSEFLFHPNIEAEYYVEHICMSVFCMFVFFCSDTYLWNLMFNLHQILWASYLLLWLSQTLVALWYLVFFQFYGWRHVSHNGPCGCMLLSLQRCHCSIMHRLTPLLHCKWLCPLLDDVRCQDYTSPSWKQFWGRDHDPPLPCWPGAQSLQEQLCVKQEQIAVNFCLTLVMPIIVFTMFAKTRHYKHDFTFSCY